MSTVSLLNYLLDILAVLIILYGIGETMPNLTVPLSDELNRRFDDAAHAKGKKKSVLVRRYIERFVHKYENPPKPVQKEKQK